MALGELYSNEEMGALRGRIHNYANTQERERLRALAMQRAEYERLKREREESEKNARSAQRWGTVGKYVGLGAGIVSGNPMAALATAQLGQQLGSDAYQSISGNYVNPAYGGQQPDLIGQYGPLLAQYAMMRQGGSPGATPVRPTMPGASSPGSLRMPVGNVGAGLTQGSGSLTPRQQHLLSIFDAA